MIFDNGSEFINEPLIRWCIDRSITYTRSRPYKKNDQAWIEQKNGSVVRGATGRDRYEGKRAFKILSELYPLLILHHNYFQPCQKLVSKSRAGVKVHKIHDKATTPYQRALDSPHVLESAKEKLREIKATLNVADLTRKMIALQNELKLVAIDIPNPVMAAKVAQRNAVYKFSNQVRELDRAKPISENNDKTINISKTIKQILQTCESGSHVRPGDFLSLGSRGAINLCLMRLSRKGTIKRVSQGVYQLPIPSDFYPTPNFTATGTNNFEANLS